MNSSLNAVVIVVATLGISTIACSAPLPEDETALSESELAVGGKTKPVLIPEDLNDPGTGCFISNPVCALRPAEAKSGFLREDVTLERQRCVNRAREWSIWCGNGPSDLSVAEFRIHGTVTAAGRVQQTNDSQCIISLPNCPASPGWAGVFGDDGRGADANPEACAVRASEYHSWCGLAPDVRVQSNFVRDGAKVGSYQYRR